MSGTTQTAQAANPAQAQVVQQQHGVVPTQEIVVTIPDVTAMRRMMNLAVAMLGSEFTPTERDSYIQEYNHDLDNISELIGEQEYSSAMTAARKTMQTINNLAQISNRRRVRATKRAHQMKYQTPLLLGGVIVLILVLFVGLALLFSRAFTPIAAPQAVAPTNQVTSTTVPRGCVFSHATAEGKVTVIYRNPAGTLETIGDALNNPKLAQIGYVQDGTQLKATGLKTCRGAEAPVFTKP